MPLLLGREFYATPALLGAVSFILLEHYCPNLKLGWLYSAFVIFILRILAIHLELYYPKELIFKGTEDV